MLLKEIKFNIKTINKPINTNGKLLNSVFDILSSFTTKIVCTKQTTNSVNTVATAAPNAPWKGMSIIFVAILIAAPKNTDIT